MKKVRRSQAQNISEVSSRIQATAITTLEENALVMEFATGVPMEEHYDLVAHDDIIKDIAQASVNEQNAANEE